MNNTFPFVSVAMPVYNAEKFLKQAIESILNQSYPYFELILVNDSSTDRSKEIIQGFSDPRIRYLENQTNLGITKTRNRCVNLAKGKYIAVLDNDDIAMPLRLEKQVAFLESESQYGICGSFYDIIDGEGNLTGKRILPVTDKEVRTYLLFENCFCNSSVMIRSELLKEREYAEGFNMIEDYYFLYTSSKVVKLANLPFFTTQYRVHGKNTSLEKASGMTMLRRKMDTLILNDLGIIHTNPEFELHTHFVTGDFDYFDSDEKIIALESWLLRLYERIKSKPEYSLKIVEKVMLSRWILMFGRSRKLSRRIIFNRLFLKFKFKYIGYFAGIIREKFSKVKSAS